MSKIGVLFRHINGQTSRQLNVVSVKKIGLTFLSIFILALAGCGGSDGEPGGSDDGEITGTGFRGTAAEGRALVNANVRIKSLSGESVSATTDGNGDFSSGELREESASTPRGPYLLRVDHGSDGFFYSIAHSDNTVVVDDDSVALDINLHPYTDLIIRNWFAIEGLDIEAEFEGNTNISRLPTLAEIDAISDELLAILDAVLDANSVADGLNLLSTPFDIGDNFDVFLDNSVVRVGDVINVIVNDPVTQVQVTIINAADVDTDFTSDEDTPPSVPENLRVLPENTSTATIVWQPSEDDKGVAFYNVYRDGVEIASTPFPVYTDAGLTSGVSYDYTVEAIDGRGQTSGQTSAVSIVLDGDDTTAPPSVTALELIETDDGVSLSWSHEDLDDVATFRILRGASGNVINVIGNANAVEYSDLTTLAGTEYCYRVVAVDAADNEAPASEEACITLSGGSTGISIVFFSSTSYTVNESASSATITVERAGNVGDAISVDYTVSAGTAMDVDDFTAATGTLSWAATDAEPKTFEVLLATDMLTESDETVSLTLSNPSASARLSSLSGEAVLTIIDSAPMTCIDLTPTDIIVDTTLSAPCYNVNESIVIRDTATLTITEGVRLVFAASTELGVEEDGILDAIGTANSPVIFSGAIAAPGYWDGLEVTSIALSTLDHTIVEYGGGSSFNNANIGVSFAGRLSVTNTTIRHSASYGVRLSGDDARLAVFSGNTLTANEMAPIDIQADQIGVLAADNVFAGNITTVGGDNDYIQVRDGSDVNSDQTWNAFDVEYRMPVVSIDINAELTLAPRVELVFPADAQMNVREAGTLKAIGTAEFPIYFTGLEATPGFWKGIQFTFNDNANEMDHTVVEYGGGSGGNVDANIGVFGENGRLSLRNSTLRHSASDGFEFGNAITLVMDNVISVDNNRPGTISFNDAHLLDNSSRYFGNTDDRVVLVSSNSSDLSSAQTVPNIGVPYFASENGTAQVSSALVFAPGVEIQFNSGGGLNVSRDGSITAQGNIESPIIFTGAEKTKGYWNGIQFTFSDSPNNIFDHTVVEYAGAPSGNTQALIGFFSDTTNGQVTNTVLRGSQTNALWLNDATTGDFTTGNIFEDIDGENVFIEP